MDTNLIGQRIKAALAKLEKTQGWLAEKANVSNNAVSKWIKTGKISKAKLPLLRQLLGIELDDLIESDGALIARSDSGNYLAKLSEEEQILVAGYRVMTDDVRKLVLTAAEQAISAQREGQSTANAQQAACQTRRHSGLFNSKRVKIVPTKNGLKGCPTGQRACKINDLSSNQRNAYAIMR